MKKIIVFMMASVIMILSITSMASAHGISLAASFACVDKSTQSGVVTFSSILWENEAHMVALGPVAYGNVRLVSMTVTANGTYKMNITKAQVPNGTYKVFNVDLAWDTRQEYVGTVIVDWTGCETVKVTTPPSTTTPPAPPTTFAQPPIKETERSAELPPVEIGTPIELANTGINTGTYIAVATILILSGALLMDSTRQKVEQEEED